MMEPVYPPLHRQGYNLRCPQIPLGGIKTDDIPQKLSVNMQHFKQFLDTCGQVTNLNTSNMSLCMHTES